MRCLAKLSEPSASARGTPLRSRQLMGALCLTLALAALAPADDGGIENVGGAARLLADEGHIRMEAETVHAVVSENRVEVDCVFRFHNQGAAETVLVGFPDRSDNFGYSEPMKSFRSWVDGVEVPCDTMADLKGTGGQAFAYWWTRRVAFGAGQTRVIHDRYVAKPGSSYDGSHWFSYILYTGASWAGTIGSAVIDVDLRGISPRWIQSTDPQPTTRGHTLSWTFNSFEPGSADGSPNKLSFHWQSPRAKRAYERSVAPH